MKRKASLIIYRLVLIGVLSALGIVLMQIKIPYFIPWINIDPSDTVILVAYVTTSWYGAIAVAVIKALIDMFISSTGYFGIGQITALIASLAYILGLFLTSHVFKLFNKGLLYRIFGYLFIALLVSAVMTLTNIIFATPTYLTGKWASCFDSDTVKTVEAGFASMGYNYGYFLSNVFIYLPFNLIKAVFVCTLYEILLNRVIFVLFKNSKFFSKYSLQANKEKKEENEKDTSK